MRACRQRRSQSRAPLSAQHVPDVTGSALAGIQGGMMDRSEATAPWGLNPTLNLMGSHRRTLKEGYTLATLGVPAASLQPLSLLSHGMLTMKGAWVGPLVRELDPTCCNYELECYPEIPAFPGEEY